MALSDLMTRDAKRVFLNTSDFAVTVTRYVGGESTDTESVTALVHIMDEEEDEGTGREHSTRGQLEVAASQTVTRGDAFLINEERYEVSSVSKARDGMKRVQLHRSEPRTHTQPGRSRR